MLNEETISSPKKIDLLLDKVMPFSEDIEVALPSDRNQEIINDLDTLTDILIVVNGEIKLRYTNEPERMGYRNWKPSNVNVAGAKTYLCPVSVEDTKAWRGLVQAFIKQRRFSLTDNSEESPYDIVPLFIAKRAPGNDGGATGSIELGYEMNISADGITVTVTAILQNTSGRIAIEGLGDGTWFKLATLDGESSRTESWTSGLMLFDWAESNEIRAYDVSYPDSIHATLTIPSPLQP